MATRNDYIANGMVNSSNFDQPIPTRAYCKAFERLMAEKLGFEFCGGSYDNGIDAIGKDGKRYQFKAFFENKASFTCEKKHKINSLTAFDRELRHYLTKFDILVLYIGNLRGEPFNKNNILIIKNKQEQYEWLFKRAYVTLENKQSHKNEIQFNKTTTAFAKQSPTSLWALYEKNGYTIKGVKTNGYNND